MSFNFYNDDIKNTFKDNGYKTEVKELTTQNKLL
jgi:hypothetical protein